MPLPLPSPILARLAPTWPAYATLLLVWNLRLAAWGARRAWDPELPALRDVAKGLAWDAALVLALVMAARLLVALRPGPATWRLLPVLATGALAVAVRFLDLAHCVMVRSHWTADAFLYLDTGFAASVFDPRLALGFLAGLGTAGLLAWLVRVDAVRARPSLPVGVLGLLLAAGPAAWAIRDGVQFPAHATQARLVPEVNFALRWQVFRSIPQVASAPPSLPAATWQKFARLGLVAPGVKAGAQWPLLRKHLNETPFPLPLRPDAPARPNVVVTFLESTNALFIHELSGHYRGLMPELGALARQMAVAPRFYNTTSPTIAALVTGLCSVHPPSHPHDLQPGHTVAGQAAYSCLADLLRDQGYRTVFVQAARRTVTGKDAFLRGHGFDEVHGREELEPRFADRHQGPWGPHDDDLATYVQEQVERLEALQARDNRPFLLVMLTLDSHDPGMAGPDCQLPAGVQDVPDDAASRQLLASYHCSDRAIGRLGRHLLADGRRQRTLWLVTADHAAFPGLVPAAVYPPGVQARHFMEVPLLLHDPRHDLPRRIDVLGGTADLTPTLTHLLGLADAPNSLTGMSLFGRRPAHPLLVGRIGERLAFVRTADQAIEAPIGLVEEWCQQGRTLLHAAGEPVLACDVTGWLAWQDALWQGQRLLPRNLQPLRRDVDHEMLQREQATRDATPHAGGVGG